MASGRVLTDNAADTVRGIGLVALAYFILSIGDAAAKWVVLTSGVAWVMLWRGLFGAGSVVALTAMRGGIGRIAPVRWGPMLLRAALSSFTSTAWYLSWRHMQLADTYALAFTAPLMMTLLAVPMLGERIRWRRMLSTGIGFCGVLVMVRPGGNLWNPALPLLFSGIVAMAITRIMARQLSRTETPECQSFCLMLSHAATGVGLMALYPPHDTAGWEIWLALVFLGGSSGIAHCIFSAAFGLAPVAALAPYEYTMLIWGGAAGFAVFGEVPAWTTLAGAAIVAAAGLYNLHREHLRRRDDSA
jgi:drug/metabolite transporter (DMT)-like permease